MIQHHMNMIQTRTHPNQRSGRQSRSSSLIFLVKKQPIKAPENGMNPTYQNPNHNPHLRLMLLKQWQVTAMIYRSWTSAKALSLVIVAWMHLLMIVPTKSV